MAHWAKVNSNNRVEQVIVADVVPASLKGNWIQTSYNTYGGEHRLGGTPLRKNFASPGFTYDPQKDAFIPPKPGNDWVLNEETCLWENPSAAPVE
jgi:hypothetical protein